MFWESLKVGLNNIHSLYLGVHNGMLTGRIPPST
jgi:hypothetical protein